MSQHRIYLIQYCNNCILYRTQCSIHTIQYAFFPPVQVLMDFNLLCILCSGPVHAQAPSSAGSHQDDPDLGWNSDDERDLMSSCSGGPLAISSEIAS